ncbi:MAG: hypothetical protein U0670_18665 [Anaerolineae bacterium]
MFALLTGLLGSLLVFAAQRRPAAARFAGPVTPAARLDRLRIRPNHPAEAAALPAEGTAPVPARFAAIHWRPAGKRSRVLLLLTVHLLHLLRKLIWQFAQILRWSLLLRS